MIGSGSRPSRELGSSLTESLLLGLVTILPLAFMVVEFGMIQRAAIATSAAAREGCRAFVVARSAASAAADAERSAREVLAAHGLSTNSASVQIRGSLKRREGVEVEVAYMTPALPVPLIGEIPPMRVTSRHSQSVDGYRSIAP